MQVNESLPATYTATGHWFFHFVIMSPVCDSGVLERRRRDLLGSQPPHSDQASTKKPKPLRPQ
ncbi:hypothetical protein ACWD4L_28155, partial [Streptomyces sp. NPDC002596]